MGKIVLLDDSTINKIAAGEVIERPASAVKEVMENSIDAGATAITVEIKNGGISYIRVTDNGKGIMQDDLEIAFERHATSKLRRAEDLDNIKSMGFRGEALASIAAISKVTLNSKTADCINGYKVVVEGGKILSKEETGCQNGTSITIENLFYNTPVRYKFLKKDFSEAGYIEDAVTRIALAHPEIAIKLINTGKTVIQTSGNGDIKPVIYSIYGKEVAENLIDVNYTYEDIIVQGVIGKPEIARSNRSKQLFFINKRFVKDKTLSSATEQAFKGTISAGKYGFLVLNIDMDPKKVDVNVHPAKLEVRFQDENKIFKAVYHSIKEGLSKIDSNLNAESNMKISDDTINFKSTSKPKFEENVGGTSFANWSYKLNNSQNDNLKESTQTSNLKNSSILTSKVNENVNSEENISQEERKNEETFEAVMAKLHKMQSLVNSVKNTTDSNIVETKEVKSELETDLVKPEANIIEPENVKTELKEEETKDKVEINIIEPEKTKTELETNIVKPENKSETDIVEAKNNPEMNKVEVKAEPKLNVVENKEEDIKEKIERLKREIEKQTQHKVQDDEKFLTMYEKNFGVAVKKEEQNDEDNVSNEFKPMTTKDNISVFESDEKYISKPTYKYVGISFNEYIIIEMKSEMCIVNINTANERLLYERLRKSYYNSEENSQLMLLPDVIVLSRKQMGIYNDNKEMFKKAGFVVDEFGEDTVKLSGVPEVLIDLETKKIFLETLEEINTVARTAKQEVEEKFIQTVACKAAEKSNAVLSQQDATDLIDRLLQLKNPFDYVNGKPVVIKMSRSDIEKKFSRR